MKRIVLLIICLLMFSIIVDAIRPDANALSKSRNFFLKATGLKSVITGKFLGVTGMHATGFCHDSDAGVDADNQGQVHIGGQIHNTAFVYQDYCQTTQTLVEYYCGSPLGYRTDDINCQAQGKTCQNGECVGGITVQQPSTPPAPQPLPVPQEPRIPAGPKTVPPKQETGSGAFQIPAPQTTGPAPSTPRQLTPEEIAAQEAAAKKEECEDRCLRPALFNFGVCAHHELDKGSKKIPFSTDVTTCGHRSKFCRDCRFGQGFLASCNEEDGGDNIRVGGKLLYTAFEDSYYHGDIGMKIVPNKEVNDVCQVREGDKDSTGNYKYKDVEECTGDNCFVLENYCHDVTKNKLYDYSIRRESCQKGCVEGQCVNLAKRQWIDLVKYDSDPVKPYCTGLHNAGSGEGDLFCKTCVDNIYCPQSVGDGNCKQSDPGEPGADFISFIVRKDEMPIQAAQLELLAGERAMCSLNGKDILWDQGDNNFNYDTGSNCGAHFKIKVPKELFKEGKNILNCRVMGEGDKRWRGLKLSKLSYAFISTVPDAPDLHLENFRFRSVSGETVTKIMPGQKLQVQGAYTMKNTGNLPAKITKDVENTIVITKNGNTLFKKIDNPVLAKIPNPTVLEPQQSRPEVFFDTLILESGNEYCLEMTLDTKNVVAEISENNQGKICLLDCDKVQKQAEQAKQEFEKSKIELEQLKTTQKQIKIELSSIKEQENACDKLKKEEKDPCRKKVRNTENELKQKEDKIKGDIKNKEQQVEQLSNEFKQKNQQRQLQCLTKEQLRQEKCTEIKQLQERYSLLTEQETRITAKAEENEKILREQLQQINKNRDKECGQSSDCNKLKGKDTQKQCKDKVNTCQDQFKQRNKQLQDSIEDIKKTTKILTEETRKSIQEFEKDIKDKHGINLNLKTDFKQLVQQTCSGAVFGDSF